MNAPEWRFIAAGLLGAIGAGVTFPIYSLIFSEMLEDMLTKRGDPLMDAARFWALMFLALVRPARQTRNWLLL